MNHDKRPHQQRPFERTALAMSAALMTFGCFCGSCESDEKLILKTRFIPVGSVVNESVRQDALIGTKILEGTLESASLDTSDAIHLKSWDPSGKLALHAVSRGEATLSVMVDKGDRTVKEAFKLEAVPVESIDVVPCAPDAVHVRGTKARFKLAQRGTTLGGKHIELPTMLSEFPVALPEDSDVSMMANSYTGEGFVLDVGPDAPERITFGAVDGIHMNRGTEVVFIDPSEIDDIVLHDVDKGKAPLLQPEKRYEKRRANKGTSIEVAVMSKGRRVCLDHQISFKYTHPGVCTMKRIEQTKPSSHQEDGISQKSWRVFSGRKGYDSYLKFEKKGTCEVIGQIHFGELLIESKTPLLIDVKKKRSKRARRRR